MQRKKCKKMQRVEFTTTDNIKIVGDYYSPSEHSQRGVVLLHMMPADRKSWQGFAEKLCAAGYHVLAIDLRGHGESGGGDYHNFSDKDHQASIEDVQGAVKYLEEQGVAEVVLGGASIGANLTVQFMAANQNIRKGFALSAGLDYYGVRAIDESSKLSPDQNILFAGSRDDGGKTGNNCGKMAEELYAATAAKKEKIIFETGGHGTRLFASHPDLMDQIISFLNIH